jgi:hypothetical protein
LELIIMERKGTPKSVSATTCPSRVLSARFFADAILKKGKIFFDLFLLSFLEEDCGCYYCCDDYDCGG